MKAIVITQAGGPDVLAIQDREIPSYESHEVLIHVHAAGINRPDILQRMGKYAAPPGVVEDIPGLEVAGVIKEIGSQVSNCKVNDEVMVLLAGGGYAEYVVAPAALCIKKPANISFTEAAILPETLYTVWHNVFQRGKLIAGERFLVHGGAGGIGSTAIQLAHLFGAKVYTTVSSQEKESYCRSLGAQEITNYKKEDFETRFIDARINVILDAIGGPYFSKNLQILEDEGRLIYINAIQGPKVELNLLKLMQKRILLSGSTLRARDLAFKIALTHDIIKEVIPLIAERRFIPQLYKVFAMQEISKAHQQMEDGQIFGKIAVKFLC